MEGEGGVGAFRADADDAGLFDLVEVFAGKDRSGKSSLHEQGGGNSLESGFDEVHFGILQRMSCRGDRRK
ncbi:hypothetical protein D3C87_1742400 [compost metagenome]